MTYNLLYLDDDPRAVAIADGFNTTGSINVRVSKPTSFETQIEELIGTQDEFQGLILDLRLDENLSDERKAHYTAPSLAQQIRSKVGEQAWRSEFPIILFTTQGNIDRLYASDVSSHDLFDLILIKDRISDSSIQYKIHAVVDAYKIITITKPSIEKILGLEKIDFLDRRIFTGSLLTGESVNVYTYAKYIFREMISTPGPLINELYLAARLGVSIDKSDDWPSLKHHLTTVKYTGVFSGAWQRWWMFLLNNWWEEVVTKEPLATLDARERVSLLSEKLKLPNLIAAEPLPKAASYRYWTICQGYCVPLDPREGLRIDGRDPLPWQETMYISVEAALERIKRDQGLKVHPLEKERFNQIKKSFT